MLPKHRLSYAQGYLELGMLAEAESELDQITGTAIASSEFLTLRLAVRHEQKDWPAVRDLFVVCEPRPSRVRDCFGSSRACASDAHDGRWAHGCNTG